MDDEPDSSRSLCGLGSETYQMPEHLGIVLQLDRIEIVCRSKCLFQPIARVRRFKHSFLPAHGLQSR